MSDIFVALPTSILKQLAICKNISLDKYINDKALDNSDAFSIEFIMSISRYLLYPCHQCREQSQNAVVQQPDPHR